jgi:amino acid adenylation domain-containing protein
MSTERIDLGERLSSLSPDELESLLRSLDQVERTDATGDKDATQQLSGEESGEGIFPATYAQILFWRQYDADRGGSNNHQSMAFRIRGGLDVEALKSSFQILSDSQPSLRTVYFEVDRDVWQHIKPSLPIPFDFIDSDALPDIEEFLKRPFDLESEPPIRVRLVREEVDVHLLQIVLHHIASDGRSKVVMLQRLSEIYNSLKIGDAAEASIHASHLGRKAVAERAWLSDPASEETKRYWQESSFSKGMGHPWPGGRHRVRDLNTDPYVSDRLDLDLGEDLSQRLQLYAAERGMTPLQVMMGCYFLCLQRLGSGGAVTFGMPVDMRNREEDGSMVGCFMNVVPVTMDAEPPGSIDDYLALAAERMRSAVEHARMPLFSILEVGFSAGDSARTLAWKTIVNFKEDYAYSLTLTGLSVENLPFRQLGVSGDVALTLSRSQVKDGRHSMAFSADIDVSKISLADAAALLATWRSVMTQCVSRQITLSADIDILLPGEKERLRELSGRDNKLDFPATTLPAIFHQTAQCHPELPAIIEADGRETTYAGLQAQAYRISSFLKAQRIEKESIVAIHMHRSPALLASMLGVLDAGGAFLLLEPSLPVDRLRTMAEQARVSAVITGVGLNELPGFGELTHRFDDILSSDVAGDSEGRDACDPSALAYVMFTSGSTGVPKGAMVEHGNVVNWLSNAKMAMGFGIEDRTLYKYPLSWDVGLTDLLMPMLTGGAVVMADPGSETDVQRIADLVVRHRATYVHFAPGVLRAFLQVPDVRKVNGILRNIHCGGETLPGPLLKACLETIDARLYHRYGPTETTMSATHWVCDNDFGPSIPPIGRPNSNVDILIMDSNGRPVPPGMNGEMWIGGAQTGRGYINNEEETRRRFVDDPLETGSGRRYYRTGDMARFLSDGNLLFLGRMDDQLKVRGVRVELGDVGSALLRCKGVRAAVVLPEPDGEGSSRLRGWVTLKEGVDEIESSIQSSLLELLPGYMIPFRIHVIDTIPLTPHGKTDHRALRAMAENEELEAEGLPLTSPTEHRLAAVWSELLGMEVRHRDADFFRLGGHSLIAMRMAGRLQKDFGVSASLPDFYRDGRLDRLAALIDEKQEVGIERLRISDMPARLPGELVPMSGSQRRMWMLQRLFAKPSAYHNAHVFSIPSSRSAMEVKEILQSMAERHGILRTRLWQDSDGFWQEELKVADWKMDWIELAAVTPEECSAVLSGEHERVFDLSRSPGWRARWVKQRTGEDLLLLVFHHALTDEWSMNLFRKEFHALLSGKISPVGLQKPDHNYIDFSRWQYWTFSQGLSERLEAYWTARLSDLGEPVRLSTDLVPANGDLGRSTAFRIPVESSTRHLMDTYCKSEGLSRFAVWMAVWQILHSRLGSGEEVVIATPVSERDRPEWQDLMGMCLNTLPIRMQVDDRSSFRSFSKKSHQSLAGDLAHVQLPYEDIVRLADGNLGIDGQGLPQVMFVWHGEYEWSEENGSASGFPRERRHAKNPISIHITDRPEDCRMSINYDDSLFLEETAKKILLRFEAVARQVMENPDMRISEIDILLPGERERLLELSGRNNKVAYPENTLQEIFRQTAEQYPDRPAVFEADGRETSYAEMQSQVSKVAAFLRAEGIEKEAVVAIHMNRSSFLLASTLGVLEAGGAFLLLEPSLPMERLRTIVDQSGVAAVISVEGMDVIPGYSRKTHLIHDMLSSNCSCDLYDDEVCRPDSLAYVVFTSGSTGIPKGVMVEHRNILNRFFYTRDSLRLDKDLRILQKTPLSFDVCIVELLFPMLTGGAVVFCSPGIDPVSVDVMLGLIERFRITYLPITPSVLRNFLHLPDVGRVNGMLRFVNCGGESLSDSILRDCLSILDVRVNNVYGPAETALAVTLWACHIGHGHPNPPIGRPNANVDLLIMDAMGRPVPPGMSGELWIGGAQTGRGYINNGEETAKRFVEDPFEHGSGRRYYRTGDLARFLSDGNLLFLGRIDDQLKVRGARIELGDVDSALLRCEGVSEAVVLAEPDGEGSNRLRGWVTATEGYSLQESGIRTQLSGLLPGYMIPFRIHVIASLPVTPHGKTDHKALRAHPVCKEDDLGGIPLKTPTERWLASLWSEWLGMDVSHGDFDFFRQGGHSLLLMRLVGMIRKTFGITLDMKALFQLSLLHEIAGLIDAGGGAKNETAEIEFSPVPLSKADSPIKLYVMIGGHGLLTGFTKYKILAEKLAWPINVSALPDPEVNAGSLPRISHKDLTTGYAEAILAEHTQGPIMLMGECFGGIDAHAIACYLQDRTTSPIHVILLDTIYSRGMKRITPPDFLRPGGHKTLRKGLWDLLGIFRTQKHRHLPPEDNWQIQDLAKEALRLKLFDPDWYLAENKDVADAALDPVFHYLNAGWKEGRSPSPWFCTETYEMMVPGFSEITQDPIRHFMRFGLKDKALRNPILRLAEEWMSLLSGKVPFELFDEKCYRTGNQDLLNLQTNPLIHYTRQGWRERRRPSGHFSQWLYAAICPYFDPATQNPVLHYLLMGRFDPGVETLMQQLYLTKDDRKRITSAGWFDAIWYANSYASVMHYEREPLSHYMTVGWKLCRKPFEAFDEKIFTHRFPDYRPGSVSPLRYLLQLDKIPLNDASWEQNQAGTGKPTISDAQETDKEIYDLKLIHHVSDILANNWPGQPDVITDLLSEGFDEKEGGGLFSKARSILRRDYEPSPFRGTIHVMASQVLQAVCPHLGWAETAATDVRTYSLAGDHESYLFWEDAAINGKRILGLIQDILAADLKNQPGGDEH